MRRYSAKIINSIIYCSIENINQKGSKCIIQMVWHIHELWLTRFIGIVANDKDFQFMANAISMYIT